MAVGSAFPRRRLVACESGDELHVALAHAAEIGPLPFPDSLQLAARSSASSCDHMCNPSRLMSAFLACDGLRVVLYALHAVAVFQSILLLLSVVTCLTAAVVQTWQSRFILD